MTDETVVEEVFEPSVPAEDPTPQITIRQLWGINYEETLARLLGNGVTGSNNRADKQQYRLQAARTADILTQLEVANIR